LEETNVIHPSLVDAEDALLVVVDVQEKLLPAIAGSVEIAEQCRRLILGAGELRLPILLTEQYPKGLGPTVGPIAEALEEAKRKGSKVSRFEKTSFSACGSDEFLDEVEAAARQQVLLCGIEAHICVLQTTLDLIEQGNAPFVAADATGSRNPAHRELALARIRQADGIVAPVESFLYELVADSTHPAFKPVSALIKEPAGDERI
jgi:nicotinamidase-related amidase